MCKINFCLPYHNVDQQGQLTRLRMYVRLRKPMLSLAIFAIDHPQNCALRKKKKSVPKVTKESTSVLTESITMPRVPCIFLLTTAALPLLATKCAFSSGFALRQKSRCSGNASVSCSGGVEGF